jgi:hypothetical protein
MDRLSNELIVQIVEQVQIKAIIHPARRLTSDP